MNRNIECLREMLRYAADVLHRDPAEHILAQELERLAWYCYEVNHATDEIQHRIDALEREWNELSFYERNEILRRIRHDLEDLKVLRRKDMSVLPKVSSSVEGAGHG